MPNNNQLVKIIAANNCLTTFNYACCNPLTLKDLKIVNNNLILTDLAVFTHLVNLTDLEIGNSDAWIQKGNPGNQFTGSLASFQELTKLEKLNIDNFSLQPNLEYLPSSLQDIYCNFQIRRELILYGNNLQLWQAYHPDLMKQVDKAIINLTDYQLVMKKQIAVHPVWFEGRETQQTSFNHSQQLTYSDFLVKDIHPFSWEIFQSPENKVFWENSISLETKVSGENDLEINHKKQLPLSSKRTETLPLRLYNLTTKQVINSKDEQSISNYLILSYCWGTDWEKTPQSYGQSYQTDLTKLGRKALNKVQVTHSLLKEQHNLNTDYIWIDNFCINQSDRIEKGKEVANQRKYFSNATATLIAIDAEIGNDFALSNARLDDLALNNAEIGAISQSNEDKFMMNFVGKIFHSAWFHRSWTFQEGLLSKQTIFMFDDVLIDGRRLALYWGGTIGTYNPRPCIFITPFGWSAGNKTEQNFNLSKDKSVSLNLGEALFVVSHREQTILLDKVYSILGLLSYGNKIEITYHQTNHIIEDLENKLAELINQAYFYNPKEVLTYLGERNSNGWWLPIINANGSFQIAGSLNYDEILDQYYLSQIQQVTKQGIQLKGHWTIKDEQNIVEIDRFDEQNNALLSATIQFTLDPKTKIITIKQVEKFYYSHGKQPTNLYIDMINLKVIEGEREIKEYLKSLENQQSVQFIEQNESNDKLIDLKFENQLLDENLVAQIEQLNISS